MEIRKDYRYTETHEWAKKEGNEVVIGISDFAQQELGDVVYVELPEVGDELKAGEECGIIDSAKTTSPINNPIDGTVTRINHELEDHPELVNKSPYDEGWMYALEPADPNQIDQMMDAQAYEALLQKS